MSAMIPKSRLKNLYRRVVGRYSIEDPRIIAKEAPYTFYIPSAKRLSLVQPADGVKLIFRSVPPSDLWNAERMWVRVTDVDGENITGELDSKPKDLPQLKIGDVIQFKSWQIIDIAWSDPSKEAQFPEEPEKQHWNRCLVDRCILDEGKKVHFLYREPPDLGEDGDKFPDSGWRIRGDYRGLADDEVERRDSTYVALGAVLNADDSWIDLIDSPIGSKFMRDFETGEFVACEK